MKEYKAVTMFTDLHDKDYRYEAGDTFPRKGIEVTQERLDELASSDNKRKEVLIEAVEDNKPKVQKASKKKDEAETSEK